MKKKQNYFIIQIFILVTVLDETWRYERKTEGEYTTTSYVKYL